MTMYVSDIMEANPAFCVKGEPVVKAAQLMETNDCGLIPVVADAENRQVVGVVTDRDIVIRLIAQNINPMQAKVDDAMSADVQTLDTKSTLSDAARLMGDEQIRRVVIVDDGGQLAGVLSQADVATARTQPGLVAQTVEHISRAT